ncbi:hypothetical protein C8Q74DRAFT_1450509 [Fomes fomentarius]|nr:hypothetical protein C8Q74DRAFT_1450509 [Fomes fomentarius]
MTDVREPALPWDILREIAFICPGEICTTLMRTCTFFYHEAAASILGHTIHLYNESVVTHFLRFLRAGKKPRYPCVRNLSLGFHHYFSPSPDTANALANAITLMAGLVVVRIFGEYTLWKWPAIGDAIASLPSLRQISLTTMGLRSWQLLFSLRSAKLRSIELHILAHSGADGADEELSTRQSLSAPSLSSHPVQLFGRWTSTLTELTYHRRDAPPVQDASPSYSAVYPMMRTLSIRHRGRLDPTPYIRAFPNLAHLNVDTQLQSNDDVHGYRTSNIHSQRERQRLGTTSPSQHAGWQELIQFNGPLVDLYALALDSRISHIRLDDYTDDIDLALLSAVLADARPVHLNIYRCNGILQHPTDNLASILQTQGGSRLESLVVSCQIDGCTPLEDVAFGLCSLAASLAMLPGPFRRLRLAIYSYLRGGTYQSPADSEPHRRTIAAAHVDVEDFVQIFVKRIPALEDAFVKYSNDDGRGKVVLRQATFMGGRGDGQVMRIGGAWVTDDPLDCSMFELQ